MAVAENDKKLSEIEAEIKTAKDAMNKSQQEKNQTVNATDAAKKLLTETEKNKTEAENRLK